MKQKATQRLPIIKSMVKQKTTQVMPNIFFGKTPRVIPIHHHTFFDKTVRVLFYLVCLFLLIGCEKTLQESEYDQAVQAYNEGSYPIALALLESTLAKEERKEFRWQAWELLLDITEKTDDNSALFDEYFSAMLLDFEDDPKRLKHVLKTMADYYEQRREYTESVLAWMRYIDVQPMESETEHIEAYLSLARNLLHTHQLNEAETVIQHLLTLPLSETQRGHCLLDLVRISFLSEDHVKSKKLAKELYEQDGIAAEICAEAGFILADILEMEGKEEEALALFISIKDTFPNTMVVDFRIDRLSK